MNHVILVGRLTDMPKVSNIKDGSEPARMVVNLAVPRTFRNSDGIYETDFIRCVLWNGIAKKTKEYCKKGDTVCVRGRIQVLTYQNENDEKKYLTEVIVESIAFVCSVKKNNEERSEKEENI